MGCMHLSPPWHSQTKPEALPCSPSPSPHSPASYTMEMSATAWSKTPQRGCVPGSGHAADVHAADLGRRIPREASVALQACSGFHRPGEACVGVLLARERIPPFCLSLALSPAPVKAQCQPLGPGAGAPSVSCSEIYTSGTWLYVRVPVLLPLWKPLFQCKHQPPTLTEARGPSPAVVGMRSDSCHILPWHKFITVSLV